MATVKAKPAAGPNPRRPHSPEARAKIAAANKGRTLSPETRAKIAAASKGRRRGISGSAAEGGGT